MLIRQYLAPDGYVVSLQNCMNEETIAGVVGWGKTLGCIASSITRQPAGARPYPPRRRQGRRGAHGVPRRRGARPHHAARRGGLPAGRLRRQRQGDRQPVGRALVEARRQRHGQRALRLHRPARRRDAAERADPPLLRPGSAAKRSASGRRSAISSRRSCTCRPRRSRAPARATRRRCAPATSSASRTSSRTVRRAAPLDGPGHAEGPAHRDRVPQRLGRARGREGRPRRAAPTPCSPTSSSASSAAS